MTINAGTYGDHNVYEDEDGIIVFHLNRMLGSREKARELTSVLPGDLSGKTIEIIATDTPGATPSFVDEFLTQLVYHRNVRKLVIVNADSPLQSSFTSFALLYGVDDRLKFEEQY